MIFYVYVYRDPRPTKNNQPVYVGKGHGGRDMFHWLSSSHNRKLQRFLSYLKESNLVPIVERVLETTSETEAFTKEVELISFYGRADIGTGTLFNLTSGGDGCVGFKKTAKHKAVDSARSKARWKDPSYRNKVLAARAIADSRPERIAKRPETSRGIWVRHREKIGAAIATARQTPESRAKTKQQSLVQWAKPEYATKMKAIKAEIDARPEVREARSRKLKARWDNPTERECRRVAMKLAAASRYKAVHAMPENKTYESVTAFCAACGVVRSTAYIMLKGGVVKQGKFKGWTLTYA